MGLRGRTQFLDQNCFFVTTTCYKWYHLLAMDSCKDIIVESMKFANSKYETDILGYVIMPNHMHLIIYFRRRNELSNWMRDMKKFTAVMIRKEIEKSGQLEVLESLRVQGPKKQVFKIWEDRFDDLFLESTNLLEIKLDYIHLNPLQEHWSLVDVPEKWKYSSASFYELGQQGVLPVTDYREYF
ncbi:MAG: transposase [Cyclobacteriaceae bacterium]